MKNRVGRIFCGILLLIAAAALIFYGMGYGADFFEMPIYKLLFGAVLIACITAKVLFSDSLRERFKIFFPLAFLFMLLEPEISHWANLPDENIVNNWLVLLAAVLANIAVDCIVPKRKNIKSHFFGICGNNHSQHNHETFDTNNLSSNMVYIDANKIKKSYIKNRLGETVVYYQNTDIASPDEPLTLEINNLMGETDVHVPADWVVTNNMQCVMGEVYIRPNTGDGIKLTVTGSNKMGETNIVSP